MEEQSLELESDPCLVIEITKEHCKTPKIVPLSTFNIRKDVDADIHPQNDNGVSINSELLPQALNNDVNINGLHIVSPDPDSDRNVFIRYLKRKTENLSPRQLTILIVFAFVDLLAAAVVSIQAPFYPEVASSKGASATEYGSVFGIFELTAIFASPLFGSKMSTLGPNRVFISGIMLTGVSSMIFGTLHTIENRWTFISSCLFLRVFEAIGESAYVTASFTIIAKEFPDATGITFAILETCYGVGMIIGPTLGSILYEIGGYTLPFAVMGGLLCTSAILTCVILPKSSPTKKLRGTGSNEVGNKSTVVRAGVGDIFKLIKIPVMGITAFGIVATATGVGFLCALLEPHLRQFELSKVSVGFVFVLSGGVYALTAPFWGWLCDHKADAKLVGLFGTVCAMSGFTLIGPLPFIPCDTILWLTCIGLTLFGFGMGAVYVSGFVIFLNDSIGRGYPDDVSTYGLISGMWTCMVSWGYFIGPTVGGLLEDSVGFRWGSLFVIGAQCLLIILLIISSKGGNAKSINTNEPENQ